MSRSSIVGVLAVLAAVLAGCKPDLGPPASLVAGLRVLAIRATPPDASPLNTDAGVVYDLLAVTPDGTVVGATPSWSYCLAPTPPSENNVVSGLCLGPSAQLQSIASNGSIGVSLLPAATCTLFGPLTPPPIGDAGPGRPPDPDVTGGYYQPVRADLPLSDGGVLTTFGEERLECGLVGVTTDVVNAFAKTYTLNQNPTLQGVTASVNGGSAQPLGAPDAGAALSIPAGASVTFTASWPAESAESFPAFDQATRTLVTQRENLISSWFVTGGAMALDQVEVAGTDTATSASNEWTAPASAGLVHLWVVLRDSRGGVDWEELLINVQ